MRKGVAADVKQREEKQAVSKTKPQPPDPTELDRLSVDTIRFLSVDAVQKANSGHPGLPLGAAPMAYVLWTRFLRHNPANPRWFNRDRFVLSAGHGSMLLYSLLHLTGYDVPLEQIKQFRQWGSITPGHPEHGLTPGVEATTGPLGQGFGNGVGMAIAEAYLAAHYNRPGFDIIDHCTYGLVSDGDLMEGVASEAASLAGQLQLGKLIYLFDDNHVTLSAGTNIATNEDCAQRFQAYGWHTQSVEDGNDLAAIENALRAARSDTKRPSLILVRTHLGYGSPNKQDTFEAHGSPLGVEEVTLTKQNLGWPVEPLFLVPPPALAHFREALARGQANGGRVAGAFLRVCPRASGAGPGLSSDDTRRVARRMGRGHSRLPRGPEGDGNARGIGKSHERNRASPPVTFRRIGGPGPLDAHRAQRCGRFRAHGSSVGRHPGLQPEAAGPMPAATCTLASASTGWERS